MRYEYYKFEESPIIDFEAFRKKCYEYRLKQYSKCSLEILIKKLEELLQQIEHWFQYTANDKGKYTYRRTLRDDVCIPTIRVLYREHKIRKEVLKDFISRILLTDEFERESSDKITEKLLRLSDEKLNVSNEEAYRLFMRLAQVSVTKIKLD